MTNYFNHSYSILSFSETSSKVTVMYKTRNIETRNEMRGTWGMGNFIFRGMLPNIPGNVVKHSEECPKYSGECRQTFRGMLPNMSGNVLKHSGECPRNVAKHSGECSQTIQRIFETNLEHVVKHPVERMKAFG